MAQVAPHRWRERHLVEDVAEIAETVVGQQIKEAASSNGSFDPPFSDTTRTSDSANARRCRNWSGPLQRLSPERFAAHLAVESLTGSVVFNLAGEQVVKMLLAARHVELVVEPG